MKERTRRWLIIGIPTLLLAYAIIGFFLLPLIIRSQAIQILSEHSSREVSLEKVRLNPFTFKLQLEGLQILDHDGDPFFAFDRFAADYQPTAFLKKGIALKDIVVDGPFLRVHRMEDQRFNFSDLIPGEKAPAAAGEGSPPVLHAGEIVVNDGSFVFEDTSPASPFHKEIRHLAFRLENFSTEPGQTGTFAFAAASGEVESFTLSGNLALGEMKIAGQIAIDNLNLPAFMPYIEHLVAAKVENGRLSTRLDYAIIIEEESIDLVVSSGSLALEDFAFKTMDATDDLISWKRLAVEGLEADLMQTRFLAGSVTLDGTQVKVHRLPDGGLNLLNAYVAPDKHGEPAKEPGLPGFHVAVAHVSIGNSTVRLLDEALETPAELLLEIPLITLASLSNQPDSPFSLRMEVVNPSAGTAVLEGRGSLIPLLGEGTLELTDWDLMDLNPYLGEFLGLQLRKGELGIRGQSEFGIRESGELHLSGSGEVALSNFDVFASADNQPVVSWEGLSLTGIGYTHEAREMEIASIQYLDPVFSLILNEDGSTNIDSLLEAPFAPGDGTADAEVGPKPDEATPLSIRIDELTVDNGEFRFEDLKNVPAARFGAEAIRISVNGLSSDPGARPDFSMEMSPMGTASLRAQGSLNVLSRQPFADVGITMQGLELTPMVPYFRKYVGYHLEKGVLELDLQYRLENQHLDAANQIILHQFTLGEKTPGPDAIGLPIPLAVSLLKDAAGDISINLPVEGDLSDPKFRLGNVIGTALANLIVKAATSPFSILAGLAGISAEELQEVTFEPASAELDAEATRQLEALATAMKKRPGIRLEMHPMINEALEQEALTRQNLREFLDEETSIPADFAGTEEEAYALRVRRAYRQSLLISILPRELPPHEEMEAKLLEDNKAGRDQQMQLTRQRMEAARSYLLNEGGIAPERVLLVDSGSPENLESGNSRIRMDIR